MRPSIRFEVFKRDGFTCAYCGRSAPEVTLEVDHIIPRVEGGTDDPDNLTTACWDCNRGKGGVPLDTHPPTLPDLSTRAELVRERELQLRAYNEEKERQRQRREDDFDAAWEHWFDVWGETELHRWHLPWESTVRTAIEEIGVVEVMDAMDVAAARFNRRISANAVRYFGGVLRNKRGVNG